jgi:hypothetical protein
MSIRMIQLLCPERHCIVAALHDDAIDAGQKHVDQLEAMFFGSNSQLQRRCGICGSEQLVYEDRITEFPTIETAYCAMNSEMIRQMASRALMDQLGLTADAKEARRP